MSKIVYYTFRGTVLGLHPWSKHERKIVDAEGNHLGHMVRWAFGGDKNCIAHRAEGPNCKSSVTSDDWREVLADFATNLREAGL